MPEPQITIPRLKRASKAKAEPEFCSEWQELASLPADTLSFLENVFSLSPFLEDCARKEMEFTRELFECGFDSAREETVETARRAGFSAESESEVMQTLRTQKRRLALLCGLADLGGFWRDGQVTEALSEFADAAVSATLDFILLAQHRSEKIELPDADNPQAECGLVVLGMGKLGARELNYSSDIDLIIFFEERAGIKINSDDPITLLNRMARQLIKIMQERTADGYVFRTDLRLRPDPSSTPLIIPVDAALNYYESQGQNWERSAMIKARPIAGDKVAAGEFLKDLGPYIWRRYLDFAAINDVQSIKRQIHAHKGHGEIAVLGHNVKLGRGGIREIEFFAQTQQLIAGGRNEDLRHRGTISALDALAKHGWIETSTSVELTEAYWTLRGIEHRLQMIRDEQTHLLPETMEELSVVAALSGEKQVKKFETKIRKTLELVEKHYSALFENASELSGVDGNLVFTGEEPDPATVETLSAMGYQRPEEVMSVVKGWHKARVPALRATQARELLTELVPMLLETFAKTQNPDDVIFAFDRFVSGLPAGIQLFAILKNNPELTNLLVRILDSAPRLASRISEKPHVFDSMLEPDAAAQAFEFDRLQTMLEAALSRATAFEQFLDIARQFASEIRFQIGTMVFSGAKSWRQAARDYSTLAEVMIGIVLDRVRVEFAKNHGEVPGASICVLAMGRLGSRELTETSDLDLIFLYEHDGKVDVSDGDKPLDASLYFIRLIQRFISAMSSPTAEGILYSLDFRLRPSGNAGPLATSVEGFFKYQSTQAWVWEAQALTRARPVYGDEDLCHKVENGIGKILSSVKDKHALLPEIRKMRDLIEKEKGTKDVWDVKIISGGLLDIEFVAQGLALENPDRAVGVTETLELLALEEMNGLSLPECSELGEAYQLYSNYLHLERICMGDSVDRTDLPTGFTALVCDVFDLPTINACEAHLKDTQNKVRKIFNQKFPSAKTGG